MIAEHATFEHPATSLFRFFETHRAEYQRMLRTGDVCDYKQKRPQIDKGRSKADHMAIVEAQIGTAIERIQRGDTLTDVAHSLGISPKTLQSRLHLRGLNVRKIRNQ